MKSSLSLLLLTSALSNLALATEIKSGGETSTTKEGANAFSMPAANLPMAKRLDFSVGNSFFRNPWVPAPASTDARDGLGPLFNTNGCQNCHIKDGRGHPPEPNDTQAVSMLVRLSIPAVTEQQKAIYAVNGVVPEPTYGGSYKIFRYPTKNQKGESTLRMMKWSSLLPMVLLWHFGNRT